VTTDGGLCVSWLVSTTVRRWRAQWRLIGAVLGVTILACTLLTTLGILVTTTEQNGVSSALAELPDSQSRVDITLVNPSETVGDTRELVESELSVILGPAATLDTTSRAVTNLFAAGLESTNPVSAYYAELDGIEDHADLIEGEWVDVAAPLTVALPESAATVFDLGVGDTFTVDDTELTVGAIYAAIDETDEFWDSDLLGGNGNDPAFPRPGIMDFEPIHAFGPLIVGDGGLSAVDVQPSRIELTVIPDLSGTSVAELGPLAERLDDADFDMRQALGSASASLFYDSHVGEGVRSVASGLIVTRSTVIVVSLLLLVLAIAAIGQTARLLADARAGDRQLMRSRGASTGHVLALAVVEAVVLGLVTALVSPFLATLVYRAFAAIPAAVSAGVPATATVTPLAWLTAGVTGAAFIVVLIAPLLTRGSATADETKSRGRQKVTRTGLDIALLVLAGVAYAQLSSYKTPVDGSSSLAIDPILVVGPAIVLLAGAFGCLRLLPLVARLVGHFGSRARGLVLPLAAWEIGRRAQRAATAVLLLSLALAVGTFSLSFLATWQQSQVDQADLAVGAPGRTLVEPQGGAAPVFRSPGRLGGDSGIGAEFGGSRFAVQVLALPGEARALIDRGRLSELGGDVINSTLDTSVSTSEGIEIPGTISGLNATVRIGDSSLPPAGVTALLVAVLEDDSGVLHTVNWGEVPVDGVERLVEGKTQLENVRLVGVTATFIIGFGFEQPLTVTTVVDDLEIVREDETKDGVQGESTGWFTVDQYRTVLPVGAPSEGQLAFDSVIPGGYETSPVTFAFVGWEPAEFVPAVIPTEIATSEHLVAPQRIAMFVGGAVVNIEIVETTATVPGSATYSQVEEGGVGGELTIVVDHTLLERALVEAGSSRDFADEWWVDVEKGGGRAFESSNPEAISAEVLAVSLQQSPLRVATPIALWLTILAGALLAAIGFVMHTTAGLRSRRLELAQLAAIGVPRPKLVALVTLESLITGALGAILGAVIGILLALLVGPLVASSPNGEPPVPSVIVELPWLQFLLLDLGVGLVLAIVVLVVARGRAFVRPAELLRWGGE